jgi:hypothetical protein
MTNLTIQLVKQPDGYNFSLSAASRSLLTEEFPEARPVNNILVPYNKKACIDNDLCRLKYYSLKVLLGINDTKQLNHINTIQFEDEQTGDVIYQLQMQENKLVPVPSKTPVIPIKQDALIIQYHVSNSL